MTRIAPASTSAGAVAQVTIARIRAAAPPAVGMPVTTPDIRGRLMQQSLVRDLDLPQRPAFRSALATLAAPRTPTQ